MATAAPNRSLPLPHRQTLCSGPDQDAVEIWVHEQAAPHCPARRSGTRSAKQENDGSGLQVGVRQRNQHPAHTELPGRVLGPVVEHHPGIPVIGSKHFDFPPGHHAARAGRVKGFERSLLGRNTGCDVGCRFSLPHAVRPLVRGEQSPQGSLAGALQQAFYSPDIHQVNAHTERGHGPPARRSHNRTSQAGGVR